MIKISFQQLKVFVAVAKYEHVGRAADDLHIVQSAVSMGLAELEQQLGKPLFDRIGKKLIINSNGKLLLPEAQAIMQRLDSLPQLLQQQTDLSGELRIGASSTIGNYLLPKLISQFAKLHPNVKLRLEINNTERIIQQLEQLNFDVGFIEGHCHSQNLQISPWQEDKLVIIASPEHSMAKRPSLLWKNFAMAKWILREPGSGTREIFIEAIKNKFAPDILLELGNSEAIKQAVIAGSGLSCLSRLVVADAVQQQQLVILPTPEAKLKRQLWYLTHKQRYQAPLLQAMVNFITQGLGKAFEP